MRFFSDDDLPINAPNYAPRGAYAIPPVSIFTDPSITFKKINVEWLGHILGVLSALDQPDAWQGTPLEIEDARNQIRLLITSIDDVEKPAMTLPIGFVVPYAGLSPAVPDWLLLCDGATHNRVDYPELYDILESAFILDVDTFKVPDLNEKFPLGATSSIGSVGGASTHTLTIAEMPSHDHPRNQASLDEYILVPPNALPFSLGNRNYITDGVPLFQLPVTGNRGGGGSHNNMPPYQRLRYYIVAE